MNDLTTGLKVLLASHFVLYAKTHAAHWNVTGMFFFELHKLFEEQYNELWDNVDTIAEKIRELDARPTISPQDQINLSIIDPNQDIMDATGYISLLLADHNRMIMLLNKVFALAEAANNQAIMNYLAERLDSHAKTRWFLKAHLDRIA
jgi:starvation-inducible DNA-binding protein